MKYFLIGFFGLMLLSACKKDYACLVTETIDYSLEDSLSNFQIQREVDFEVFESCINCSRKDKEHLLSIMLDHLLRQEDKAKIDFVEQGLSVKSESLVNNLAVCEEKK